MTYNEIMDKILDGIQAMEELGCTPTVIRFNPMTAKRINEESPIPVDLANENLTCFGLKVKLDKDLPVEINYIIEQ